MIKNSHSEIIPYKNEWAEEYEAEKKALLKILRGKILDIEHIGSTSIKGLQSKPIIDIAIVVIEVESADAFTEILGKIGYAFHSSSTERHFYRKGTPIKYHVSIVFARTGGFWVRQILFRDFLKNNSDKRNEYGNLKENLLKNDPTGLNSYMSGKTDFIYEILKLAGWKENQTYSDYIQKDNK